MSHDIDPTGPGQRTTDRGTERGTDRATGRTTGRRAAEHARRGRGAATTERPAADPQHVVTSADRRVDHGATRVTDNRRRRWWPLLLLLLLLLALIAVGLYFALRDDDGNGTAADAPAAGVGDDMTAVYWTSKAGPSLFRTEQARSGDDAPLEAVRTISQNQAPDPDYTSAWAGAVPTSVNHTDGVITVDFSTLPATTLNGVAAKAAGQQLIYTVESATGSTDPVRITQQGQPVPRLFGSIDASRPMYRSTVADVQNKVWITRPANDATVGTPVEVSGTAWASGDLTWRATSESGETRTGTVTPSASTPDSPYSFTADLPAGRWTIAVSSPASATDNQAVTDTKSVTVQ